MNIIGIVLSCIIDVYLFHLFLANYFEKTSIICRFPFGENIIQGVTVLLLVLCNLVGNGDINIIVTPFLLFIYTVVVFEGRIRYRLLYMVTVFCVLYGCEFLLMVLVEPAPSDYKNSTVMTILTLAVKLLSYILILVINQAIGKRKRV